MSDTIAAIATAPGVGAVGVVRVSGPDALALARQVAPSLPAALETHTLTLRTLIDARGTPIDTALVAYMRGPRSFTGEDVVELQCHGGPMVLSQVMDALMAAGARPAEAGEFTRRAFLNEKVDLVQAEAIADLIEARSAASARLAQRHLEGRLSERIGELRERLARSLTLVEAAIDFSLEEHVFALDHEELARQLSDLAAAIDLLLATYDQGRVQREGIRCVIAGRPNAGKSTLLNRLVERERAIVSETPGTTRDYLDVDLVLEGQLFRLVDTAGLRQSHDAIEAEGVRRANALIEGADLIVLVVDRSGGWQDEDERVVKASPGAGLLIWNKADLVASGPPPALPDGWRALLDVKLDAPSCGDTLRTALVEACRGAGLMGSGEAVTISRARHRDALGRARARVAAALKANGERLETELIALDMRLALDALGEVIGQLTPDDILGRIFAEFCIGK